MTAFLAAFGGAVVGGLIALAIQLFVVGAAASERKTAADERRKALGQSLAIKMLRIFSHLSQFNGLLKASFAEAKKESFRGDAWQIVKPFAATFEKIHFTTDEMTLVFSLGDGELFNGLLSMDEEHNTTADLFELYSNHRLALTSVLPAEMRDSVGRTFISKEQMSIFGPRIVELNSIVEGLVRRCEIDEQRSWSVLTRLQELLTVELGLEFGLAKRS